MTAKRVFKGLLLSLCLTLAPAALADEQAEYEAKLKELKQTIAELKSQINATKTSRDKLKQKLQSSEVSISDLSKKIERLKEELASQKKQLSRLHNERAELRQKKRQQQRHIVQHLSSAYRIGRQGNIKLLLNQQQPAELGRQMQYYNYVIDARREKLDQYRQVLIDLTKLEPKIAAKASAIERQKLNLESEHKQLLSRQSERKRTLADLNRTLADKDASLQEKAGDQRRLKKLLDEVTQALANIKLPKSGVAFNKRKGKLKWPTSGRIKHRYGSPRARGKLRWQGVFIRANNGRAVKAIHHGRVVFSDYLKGHGMLLIIDHGDGYMSLYAHNQTLLKETGDWVDGGDTIGRVGNTGGLSEPGLYFEIRHKGSPTNPARWCRA
ncbi:MAG: peptidoglycan DD-metalloendopeptidase family protein [Cellvibrionaceae bacterium]|nr:peptidoglycan DD-metalloendopeptidase family protein [Cellvibrionaceae bacterium]